MTQDTMTMTLRQQPQTVQAGGPPDGTRAEEMLAQAGAWQNVAGQVRASCQRGAEAAKELQRRRNTSGQ